MFNTTEIQNKTKAWGKDILAQTQRHLPHQWTPETAQVPSVHLEDISAIPFVQGVAGVAEYQHRARARAGEGDYFLASTPALPGYEPYCQEVLGLGAPTSILADVPQGVDPTQIARAASSGRAFEALVQAAKQAGGLVLHPYMGIKDVWDLAAQVEDQSGQPVRVLAPTPPAVWVANDKFQLDSLARELGLGQSLVETQSATTADEIALLLWNFACKHNRVALKRTRCASAMGNQVHKGDEIVALGTDGTNSLVHNFLTRTEWPEGEEVLVVEWVDATSSPSTQCWVPTSQEGEPRLDGIYEQLLIGEQKMFLGSHPSTLSEEVHAKMWEVSWALCTAFQQLGYIGRCSFDFVIHPGPHGEPCVKLTECNGRWGGTSTPMHLVDRTKFGKTRPWYLAKDVVSEALVGVDFAQVLTRVGDALYRPDTGEGRFMFYNVGPLREFGKLDVVVLGDSMEDARQGAEVELPRLLGI